MNGILRKMLGLGEYIFVAGLIGCLYLLVRPPGWYKDFRNRKFVSDHGGIYADKKIDDHISIIGTRILEENHITGLDFKFRVLRTGIPNAHALPSGDIFLTLGILQLAANDDELAAILAHEIGHLTAGHHVKRSHHSAKLMILSAILPGGLFGRAVDFLLKGAASTYSQEQELEADALSIKFLHKSGYNPMAVYSSLERAYEILDKDSAKKGFLSDFFSSHPVSEARLNEARELANTFED